jgi:hypothetical protein
MLQSLVKEALTDPLFLGPRKGHHYRKYVLLKLSAKKTRSFRQSLDLKTMHHLDPKGVAVQAPDALIWIVVEAVAAVTNDIVAEAEAEAVAEFHIAEGLEQEAAEGRV